MTVHVPEPLSTILRLTPELARSYLVGGCVRDALLGRPVKDYDIEVFGIGYEALVAGLTRWGRVDVVGHSFGVAKLTVSAGPTFDFSLPRRDSKIAGGHQGFRVETDSGITLPEAASRRDFTINAMSFDPRRGEILDFFGALDDLERRILRHIGPAFTEDPLRVLRGMQFVARFDLKPAPETLVLCHGIRSTFPELAVDRVREEWFKWAAVSAVPSRGLEFLRDSGWIDHFPELAVLIGTPQDPEWHPEGDVFAHTAHCCDALVQLPEWLAGDWTDRVVLSLAVLTHDLGKPQTTQEVVREGRPRIVSPAHEPAGGPLAERLLDRMGAPNSIKAQVVPLVVNHLAHLQAASARSVRRLAQRLAPATIEQLLTVITADHCGRPPKPKEAPPGVAALRDLASALQLERAAPKPLLLGRHLLALGLRPGPELGPLLRAAFDAQLDGQFEDLEGAQRWLCASPLIESRVKPTRDAPQDIRAAIEPADGPE